MNIWILGNLLFSLISPISYTKSMLRHKAKPHKVTRFVVWLASLASVLGVLHGGSFAGQAFAFIFFTRATYLLIMSFIYGLGGATKLDRLCLVIGLLALVAYILTHSGLITILLGVLADLIGFIPTFVKTFHRPSTEDPTFFIIEGIAALCSIIAVGSFQLSVVFPIYIFLGNVIVLGLIYRKNLSLKYYIK